MEKIAIYVDVQNIYYTVREAFSSNFNYNHFWNRILKYNCEIVIANAYAIDRGDEKQKQFQNILRGIGFNVKLKPYIFRSDGSAKGDWDVGITIDMLDDSERVDRLILLSGDGDFVLLVDRLKSHGKIVDVYGVEKLTADILKRSASNFYPINNELLLKTR